MRIFLIVLSLIGLSMKSMAEKEKSTAYYRELVQNVEAEARKNRIRDEVGFIDAYFTLGKKEASANFQKEMATSSEFVLAHLDAIASTEYQKAIIAMSTWEMTRTTFVEFLNSMADLVEAGTLDKKFFKWAQSPTESHLSGLLVREYAKSDVQNIIMRSRKIFKDQPDLLIQYDSMLTGESRRKLEQFEATMRENRFPGVNPAQVPTIQKSVVQSLAQTKAVAEPENTSTPSFRQTEEEPARIAPVETDQPEGQKRGLVLPVVAGIIAVLACVGVWIFRKHG